MSLLKQWRLVAVEACNALLGLFLLAALMVQGRDFQQASEVVPTGSFAVLLSLASFAISWARVNPPNATEREQKRVKRVGLDLLIASVLTLVSAGLLLISSDASLKATLLGSGLIALHIAFLAAGLLLGWVALTGMLREAARAASAPSGALTALDH